MNIKLHKEPADKLSDFVLFQQPLDVFKAESAEEALPQLSYLRLELARVRSGMNDFIIRASTPTVKTAAKSNTVVTLRGNKSLAKLQGVNQLVELIASEMSTRGDKTHIWETVNKEHLIKMLYPTVRFFSTNPNLDLLRFTTEALM